MLNYGKNNPLDFIGKDKIGLLDSAGAYVVNRYPWAYEAWKYQQRIHWLGEEVPLSEDLKDWNGDKLSDNERNLLMQIFRLFTQSDIEVGENYINRYMKVFQPLEVRMMLSAFTNVETIHIDAYALLLTTLGLPDHEFLAFREYSEMSNKVSYMREFNMNTCSDVSRTLAMFGGFTEGLSLYASFAMLMNFPRQNKMKGMGQIVTWSVRDESLHCECIIKLFHEWNKETGALTQSVKDDIMDVCDTQVKLEEKFIELAFEMGDVPGMTPDEIKAYIHYIADWRLTQLQLPIKYGYFKQDHNTYEQIKPHPIPWLTEILNGVEHANFFEQRSTEYSKVATEGEWHGDAGVWSMFDKYNGKK